METIYFPACGFGFWYLFGKYEHIRSTQAKYILSGSSAGSLICICSLIESKDDMSLSEMVARLGIDSATECKAKTCLVNLHMIIDVFISKLFTHIDESNEETHRQLSRLRIQTTVFHWPFWFEKRQTTPTSLAHLKELCLASCHIPIAIDFGKRITYCINGERHIDGGFIDYYIPHVESFNASSYNSLVIPSMCRALNIRDIAYNEPFLINRTYDSRVMIITPLSFSLFSIIIILLFVYGYS
jgi:hypothetical protein